MASKIDGAPARIATGRVTMNDAAPVQIVPARAGRSALHLKHISGGGNIFVGDSAVTAAAGYFLGATELVLHTSAAVYGIRDSLAANAVAFLEIYDE